jgi:hypothetical protein
MTRGEEVNLTQAVVAAIVAAATVYPEPGWQSWADAWLSGINRTQSAASQAEEEAVFRRVMSLDEMHFDFLTLVDTMDWHGSDDPHTWLTLARTVRHRFPQHVPNERTNSAAGAEAARHAAWAAKLWAEAQHGSPLRRYPHAESALLASEWEAAKVRTIAEWACVWAVEARERSAAGHAHPRLVGR